MLAYHPVLDTYHTGFRCLRILKYRPTTPIDRDRLRLLQFYLAMPSYIADIRLPRQFFSWKSISKRMSNIYYSTGDPLMVFKRSSILYDHVVGLLLAKGVLDKSTYEQHRLLLTPNMTLADEAEKRITQANQDDATLMAFLLVELDEIPVLGQDGLKARTGLMEYRYDPA